jgi:hypothetical protein
LNIYFDTEDNSHELALENRSGFEKVCTQIAAIAEDGERFYLVPKVTGSKKTAGELHATNGSVDPFLRWLRAFGTAHHRVRAQRRLRHRQPVAWGYVDRVNVTLVGGRMISAKWENCTFKDSFNIWPMF